MFIENFYKFIKYYGKGRKLRLTGFFLLSLVAGLLEFVGIALIYPFILLIVQPESIIHTRYYQNFSSFMHIENVLTNAFIIGIFVVLLFITKNLFMIWSIYLQNKFVNGWKLDINKKFMKYYLFSSYKNALKTSPSEKIYNLSSLAANTLDGFILRGITLITNAIIVSMILMLLLIKFPISALITFLFVAFSMFAQNRFFKKRTSEISKHFYKTSIKNNNKIIESINNLKDLKILSAEDYFYNEYIDTQRELNELQFKNNFYTIIPPYLVEILIVLALLILAGAISVQNINNTSDMIAAYAILVAAIFRIAPALNRIQISINTMNATRDFTRAINSEYEKIDFEYVEEKSDLKIKFIDKIEFKDVCFSYKEGKEIIKNLNLEIQKGEFIGVIGLSGAGKSTLADILMGLLPIDSGEIKVDKLVLNETNFSSLRKLVGYVPQQVNILDASFRDNVAWGIKPDEIDDDRVIVALKTAQLLDFVNSFKDGINSNIIIGSSGLSHGQKQRLAIARAIYRDSEILILDEATSALDVETEHEITKMLKKMKGSKTIIAIAHRLSTLKNCDRLIYLKDGHIVDTGSFKELSSRHADFENLVKLSMTDG